MGHLGTLPATEKRAKSGQKRANSDALKGFWIPEQETIVKISVLDQLYGQKRVNCHVFAGKQCKNTVKKTVLEGYLAYMFELASGSGTWKN